MQMCIRATLGRETETRLIGVSDEPGRVQCALPWLCSAIVMQEARQINNNEKRKTHRSVTGNGSELGRGDILNDWLRWKTDIKKELLRRGEHSYHRLVYSNLADRLAGTHWAHHPTSPL